MPSEEDQVDFYLDVLRRHEGRQPIVIPHSVYWAEQPDDHRDYLVLSDEVYMRWVAR